MEHGRWYGHAKWRHSVVFLPLVFPLLTRPRMLQCRVLRWQHHWHVVRGHWHRNHSMVVWWWSSNSVQMVMTTSPTAASVHWSTERVVLPWRGHWAVDHMPGTRWPAILVHRRHSWSIPGQCQGARVYWSWSNQRARETLRTETVSFGFVLAAAAVPFLDLLLRRWHGHWDRSTDLSLPRGTSQSGRSAAVDVVRSFQTRNSVELVRGAAPHLVVVIPVVNRCLAIVDYVQVGAASIY